MRVLLNTLYISFDWLDVINPIRKKTFIYTAKLKPSQGFASLTYGSKGIVWAVSSIWRLATSCGPQYKVAVMCCHKPLLLGCLKYKETDREVGYS